jgi:arsenate reductase
MTVKIYHNPMCSKSRQVVALVESKTSDFEIIEYLKNPLKFEEITLLLSQLNIKPLELIRIQESIWKENYKGIQMNDDEIINAIVNHPKLMERPIVTTNKKAILGRPPENILELFS